MYRVSAALIVLGLSASGIASSLSIIDSVPSKFFLSFSHSACNVSEANLNIRSSVFIFLFLQFLLHLHHQLQHQLRGYRRSVVLLPDFFDIGERDATVGQDGFLRVQPCLRVPADPPLHETAAAFCFTFPTKRGPRFSFFLPPPCLSSSAFPLIVKCVYHLPFRFSTTTTVTSSA